MDRAPGTGGRPEKPEPRGAPRTAAPTGQDPFQQVNITSLGSVCFSQYDEYTMTD